MTAKRLSDCSPDEVLVDGAVDRYVSLRKELWDGLVHLHNNVTLLRTLKDNYPGKLLQRGGYPLGMMHRNTYEHSVVIAHRLWNDKKPKVASLPNLRHYFKTHSRPEYQPQVDAVLDKTAPDSGTLDALNRAARLRHEVYAHKRPGADRRLFLIGFQDLEHIRTAARTAYNGTGISQTAFFGLFDPDNIHRAFDPIALRCHWVTSIDKYGLPFWLENIRPKISDGEMTALNALFARNTMPEIPAAEDEKGLHEPPE